MAAEFTNPLESVRVASPCSADWDAMVGNNRQRFCGQCKLNVYNLSGMTAREAENLIINAEGRLCARFFRRSDGTIITKDCPVGWQAIKRRMTRVWTAVASVLFTAVSGVGITGYMNERSAEPELMGVVERPLTTNNAGSRPEMGGIDAGEEPELTMGEVALPQEGGRHEIMGKIKVPSSN